jgi:hypothetical protein
LRVGYEGRSKAIRKIKIQELEKDLSRLLQAERERMRKQKLSF